MIDRFDAAQPGHLRPRPGAVRSTVLSFALAVLLASGQLNAASDNNLDKLENWLSGLDTLSTEFEQITLQPGGGRMLESRGTLYLKRPGQFRWEYETPFEQVIVADGKRVWLHDVELDQVSHQNQSKALAGTPAQLLAGDESITDHFEVSTWEPDDGREWVELQPKTHETDVVRIRIGFIDRRLDTFVMEDQFGQLTRFIFTDTRRNPRLDAGLFRLSRGAASEFFNMD